MTVREHHQAIVDDFGFIENRQERLGAVVDAARSLPVLPESDRTTQNIVAGCTSRVLLVASLVNGLCQFRADCYSPMVRGLVVLLARCYDGVTPADAIASEATILEDLELLRDLSSTRQNGLAAVRRRIVEHARSWE
ncbi:MAG: SufE family protein [Candidatus Synoicihabitans palmerolidicus]|nr:SufE family protein [Candidatus Synoicihabitans palmerolidicus]